MNEETPSGLYKKKKYHFAYMNPIWQAFSSSKEARLFNAFAVVTV